MRDDKAPRDRLTAALLNTGVFGFIGWIVGDTVGLVSVAVLAAVTTLAGDLLLSGSNAQGRRDRAGDRHYDYSQRSSSRQAA